MQKSNSKDKIDSKKIKEDINDYLYSLQTLATLTNIFEYNFQGTSIQGKRLITSNHNTIQPNTPITPDLVTEFDKSQKFNDYGVVMELKTDLPLERKHWEQTVQQLKKYDDDLTNWNSNVSKHDVALVTIPPRIFDFIQYVESSEMISRYKFDRNLIVVSSSPMHQANAFIFVEKRHGKFLHEEIDIKFSKGVPVAELHILPQLRRMKFYDSKPPLIYTMLIIWNDVFNQYLDVEKIRELDRKRSITFVITLQDVIDKLNEFTPITNTDCVDNEWVREAMNAFKEIGIATSLHLGPNTFEIKMMKPTEEVRDWLISKFEELEKKKAGTLDRFFAK